MTLYIGVDFHPHQQTISWCDSQTGETETFDLKHDLERVRESYSSLLGIGGRWNRGIGQGDMVRDMLF